MTPNLESKILDYLEQGNTLTNQIAWALFHTTELRVYVARLRKRGIVIEDEWREDVRTGARFKEYFVVKERICR